jgi:thiopeptide-type bacteriocin biosynthesis protein
MAMCGIRVPASPVAGTRDRQWTIAEQVALMVANPTLAARTRENDDSLDHVLRRYRSRLELRATPFGMFAGVGIMPWGETTTAHLPPQPFTVRARLGAAALFAAVAEAEAIPEVLSTCALTVAPTVLVGAERVWLAERLDTGVPDGEGAVSIRASAPVLAALHAAHRLAPWPAVVDAVAESSQAKDHHRCAALVASLVHLGILHTDLRPALTDGDPAEHLRTRLRCHAPAKDLAGRLARFRVAAVGFGADVSLESVAALLEGAAAVVPNEPGATVDVDQAVRVEGELARSVGIEAADAAAVLLRVSPLRCGVDTAAATRYRTRFIDRYGPDRLVPLAEVVSPEFGLGPPKFDETSRPAPQQDRLLVELAYEGLGRSDRRIELNDATIGGLEPAAVGRRPFPETLDLLVHVLAANTHAIDAGDYQLTISAAAGSSPAGLGLGRHADMIGESAFEHLAQIASIERPPTSSVVWADLSFLPRVAAHANLMVRPASADLELSLGVGERNAAEERVPLDELVLGIDHARLRVWWPRRQVEVRFVGNHLLQARHSSGIAALLQIVAADSVAQLWGFDWGCAESLTALPRVTRGRTVLRRAQWSIGPAETKGLAPSERTGFPGRLQRWCETHHVPPTVHLLEGDRWLPLEMSEPGDVEDLRRRLLRRRARTVLTEAIPDRSCAWLPGPDGPRVPELAVALRRVEAEPADREAWTGSIDPPRPRQIRPQPSFGPGSKWVFAKLYTGPDRLDHLVSLLADLGPTLSRGAGAARWCFLRYADPDLHLRLRVKATRGTEPSELMAAVLDWCDEQVGAGICDRVVLDTYQPEVHRYGGPAAMALVEEIFAADSEAASRIVSLDEGGHLPAKRSVVAAASIDDLLDSLGLDLEARARYYDAMTLDAIGAGRLFRLHGTALRRHLGERDPDPNWADVRSILGRRRAASQVASRQLHDLSVEGTLERDHSAVCAALAHLHANRMLSPRCLSEGDLLSLLGRVTKSLLIAPSDVGGRG